MTVGIGDIVRTAVNFVLADGTLFQNVYHHKRGGVGIVGDQDIVDALEDWAQSLYFELTGVTKNNVVEQLSSVDRIVWDTDAWVVVENIGTFTPSFVPTKVADANANQVSPFVVFKTARPRSVGRKFLFPLTEDDQSAGILTSTATTAIAAYAYLAVNDIIILPAATLVPGIPRTGVNDWLEFYVAVVTDLVGTQRKRRPGYGA